MAKPAPTPGAASPVTPRPGRVVAVVAGAVVLFGIVIAAVLSLSARGSAKPPVKETPSTMGLQGNR